MNRTHLRPRRIDPRTGVTATLLCIAFALIGVQAAFAALPSTSTPVLALERTIATTPFVNSTASMQDSEGSAYVAVDGSLWLVADRSGALFEVDGATGDLKREIPRSAFEQVTLFGGAALAGADRAGDLESLAYDATNDILYAFSGSCCSASALPTVFRMLRDGTTGDLELESYQALATGSDHTGAAWSAADGSVYVGKAKIVRSYDYVSNTTGPDIRIGVISGGIRGLDFTANGEDLIVVSGDQRLYRIDWSTQQLASGWDLDLTPFGILDSRGVAVVPATDPLLPGELYVSDGYDGRAAGDPLEYAVFVLSVSDGSGGGDPGGGDPGGGGDPVELVANPGFELDTSGWKGTKVAQLSRVAGGHESNFAARLFNGGSSAATCLLNDSPNTVSSTIAATYTASLWVRADTAGATLKLRLREYANKSRVAMVISKITLSTSWQQVTLTHAAQAGHSLDLNALVSRAKPGVCFYADNASLMVASP